MSFDLIAPHYRWLETICFGNALQRARTFWIDKISRPSRALVCGEGNGRFLVELLRIHPGIEIDCVDASAAMLDLTRRRVLRRCPDSLAGIRFFHCDLLNWRPRDSYDLVVTHFFFDCFGDCEVRSLITKLALTADSNATWLLSDFVVPSRGRILKMHARAWLRAMYLFFRFSAGLGTSELVDPTPYLEANGFTRAGSAHSFRGMLKSDLFRSVR